MPRSISIFANNYLTLNGVFINNMKGPVYILEAHWRYRQSRKTNIAVCVCIYIYIYIYIYIVWKG